MSPLSWRGLVPPSRGGNYDTGCAKFFSLFDSDTTDNVGACP